MKIVYLGHSAFKIVLKNGTTVVTDPYTKVGYELDKTLAADIVTVSHGHFDHNYTAAVNGEPVIIDGTDEYVFDGGRITAISTFHDEQSGALRGKNNVYVLQADGLTVCHFGDLGQAHNARLIERLYGVDVLLIPVGGTYTINAEQAKAYVDAIKPAVVIPMHYKPQDGTLDIAALDGFLSLFDKYTFKKEFYCEKRNLALQRRSSSF